MVKPKVETENEKKSWLGDEVERRPYPVSTTTGLTPCV